MRRLLPVVLLAAAALTAPAGASTAPLPTPGFASDNVEWLGNIPLHADTAGAHLRDGYLYVTSSTQLSIYDVRVPETPTLLSTVLSPQQAYFAEEDVDTNGSILVVSALDELRVYDVTDKSAPTQVGSLEGVDPHTVTCVLECSYAWGSEGQVFDLTDPTSPKLAPLNWSAIEGPLGRPGQTHDVTEVAPGKVLTSTGTLTLFDLTADPLAPTVVAQATTPDKRFIHANLWPRAMQDTLLLVGGETFGRDCSNPRGGAFMTWDTTDWQSTGTFTMLDEYRPAANGVQNGEGAVETYCSHWFTPRPGWEDGGQLAVGWYEHGTRFLEVAEDGQIEEIGFFSPVGTTSSAAYWASEDVLYVLDYTRGLDVLRFHDEPVDAGQRSVPTGLLATGLAPDAAPLRKPRLTPAMLVGENWRC
jgi:hypothetical protein